MTVEHPLSKLQYGSRFGADVVLMARTRLHSEAAKTSGNARYTQWFHGLDERLRADAAPGAKAPVSAPPLGEIMGATKENLKALGEDTHGFFVERLPKGHRMRKAVRANLAAPAPHLGSCKFGEIIEGWAGEHCSVIQLHIANFYGALDTSPGADFFRFASRDFDQMFYGVHILVDRSGNCIDFDRSRGRDGIAFKTRDVSLALTSVASASTGMSVAELKTLLSNARPRQAA